MNETKKLVRCPLCKKVMAEMSKDNKWYRIRLGITRPYYVKTKTMSCDACDYAMVIDESKDECEACKVVYPKKKKK